MPRPRKYADDREARLAELLEQGKQIVADQMEQRKVDITEFDGELDPDLEGFEEDVAITETSRWERNQNVKNSDHQVMRKRTTGVGGPNRFTVAQQREGAQKVLDLVIAELISPTEAYKRVGEEMGVDESAVRKWAAKHHIQPTMPVPITRAANNRWDLHRRERFFNDMLDVADSLIQRLNVWIQNPADPNIPPGFQAAAEFKTISVGAAIAHDKLTGIEDLKMQRGLRDVDSEELQAGLSEGQKRLEAMNAKTITVDRDTGEILDPPDI